MNYHYLDSNNQPAGPVSLDEIQTLVRNGKLGSNPMVCAVGASEWKSLASVTSNTATATTTPLPFSGTILSDFVGRLAKLAGGILSPTLVESILRLARNYGQYAILLGGALGLIAAIVGAIQNRAGNSFGMFLGGVAFVIVLTVAQYTASRFLGAADELIKSTPSRMSSMAFLECLGVLAILASIGALLGGTYVAISTLRDSFGLGMGIFVTAIVAAVFLASYGAIALHPRLVSTEAGAGSAGEEAIGILAFGLKAALKLVPLGFALFAVVGALTLLVVILAQLFPDWSFPNNLMITLPSFTLPGIDMLGRVMPSLDGMATMISAALIPMMSYFAFLVASLPLELWRAVLSLPGKLDVMRRAEQGT